MIHPPIVRNSKLIQRISWTATLTFLFRDDYAYIDFYNVVLYDLSSATPTVNLLANGNFAGGTHISNGYLDIPIDWTYVNPNPTTSNVFVAGGWSKFCAGGGKCWSDGTTGGYDELSQSVVVNSQDSYRISFDATVNGVAPPPPGVEESTATWSRYSTNAATVSAPTPRTFLRTLDRSEGSPKRLLLRRRLAANLSPNPRPGR